MNLNIRNQLKRRAERKRIWKRKKTMMMTMMMMKKMGFLMMKMKRKRI
uniref:Alternative protein RBM28 n=1 Tax=Homo sapiens TaxID=9606 RepID=L8ECH6_HUMAN|nr:alternative protein RBM28 [Homo sapiens]